MENLADDLKMSGNFSSSDLPHIFKQQRLCQQGIELNTMCSALFIYIHQGIRKHVDL